MAEEVKSKDSRLHLMTAIGIALAILIYIYLPAANRFYNLRNEFGETTDAARKISTEVAQLRAEKKALDNDPLYLEKVIRTELRMVRSGEVSPR